MTGSGTAIDPYVVWDVIDLQNVALDLTAYYELGQNIDASATVGWNGGLGFDPIGNFGHPNMFRGHFDGKGYTISDLTINRPAELYVGLFGYVFVPFVPGLSIENVHITGTITGQHVVGGLIGDYESDEDIANCSANVLVTATGIPVLSIAGGLIGRIEHLIEIRNCYAFGNVSGGNSVGGLIGRIFKKAHGGLIVNCSASGNVTGASLVGGLVGYGNLAFTRCHATGTVTATVDQCGGLCGYWAYHYEMTECYATGGVTCPVMAGGLVGYIEDGGTLNNCYASGPVISNGGNYLGGLVGRFESPAQLSHCYATGDVNYTGVLAASYIGGLVGFLEPGGNISAEYSYSTGNIVINMTGFCTNIGGFCGLANGNITIQRCYSISHITVTLTGDIEAVGGFSGEISGGGSIIESFYSGDINIRASGYIGAVGGLIASLLIPASSCYSSGNINVESITDWVGTVAGLIGYLENTAPIQDSYSQVNIIVVAAVDATIIAGLVGEQWGTISLSYSANSISITAPLTANIGGLVGVTFAGTTNDSFWDVETSAMTISAGGTGKRTAELQTLATFATAGWDIEGHSLADLANGYPFLSWQIPGSSPAWYIYIPGAPPPPIPKVVTLPATEIR
jgi:hypothetical protein